MKHYLIFVFSLCVLPFANSQAGEYEPITNGILSAAQQAHSQRFLGQFNVSDDSLWSKIVGTVNISLDANNRLVMSSAVDLTGSNCKSQIGAPAGIQESSGWGSRNESVDIAFWLDKGVCPQISANTITLHYNESLNRKDIYTISIVLSQGTFDPRHGDTSVVKTWKLEKISN